MYLRYTLVRPAGRLGSVPAWSRHSVEDKREGRRTPVLVHVAENVLRYQRLGAEIDPFGRQNIFSY